MKEPSEKALKLSQYILDNCGKDDLIPLAHRLDKWGEYIDKVKQDDLFPRLQAHRI